MDIQEIKQRINCIDYCKRNGIPISKSGDHCTSPFRPNADNKFAFKVYGDSFFDFVSKQGGDVIDLCAFHKYDGDRGKAIKELAEITGVEGEPPQWLSYTKNLGNMCEKWHKDLTAEDRKYLNTRGIKDETIDRIKIGSHKGRITIPYWKNGYIPYYISRGDKPKYLKAKIDGLNENIPWGLHTANNGTDTLAIVEGAFDALSFEQEGFAVLATMGGYFSAEQLKIVLSICKQFKTVFLCFDNDKAGSDFTKRMSKELFSHKIPFVIGDLPPKYKDISEYYEAGKNLNDLIVDAQNGLIEMCKRMTDKKEFADFAYKASRFVGKPEMAELFNAVRDNDFPPEWLAELKKSALAPPSEDTIAKEVTAKHTLKYRENVGFYEYNKSRGYWQRREDTEVQSYIGNALGSSRTGSKLSSIIKLIKSDCITDDEFDKKPLFCFINGTLELGQNRIFREHRENDLCSIQVDYPYNNAAYSQDWQDFIDQICNFDNTRSTLLQEMAGYILFPDCSLERIFVLTGSGGNGKSKFLEVLKAVFGEGNCSSVTATGICADFQRINISTSLLNVAQEIKSDLSGAEEYLKQIASGETISACYKGKNFVNFKPRCKMIFATNGQLKSKDTSDGLMRRLAIIDFICKFVDEPSKENEYKRDTQILEKLMKNLPAVFNWAMNGYINLMQTKKFTETYDQTDLVEDFKEASNPIITFLKDWNMGNMSQDPSVFSGAAYISNEDLYTEYQSWCIEAGHIAKSRRGFLREFNHTKSDEVINVDTTLAGKKFKGYKMVTVTCEQTLLPT